MILKLYFGKEILINVAMLVYLITSTLYTKPWINIKTSQLDA